MSISIWDSSVYAYDQSNMDWDGVLDNTPDPDTDHTFIGEYTLLTESAAGPSIALKLLQWARAGIIFNADDMTDVVTISVSNDGTNWVTRCTLTGPSYQKISGGYKYIKATRVTGNGAVLLVGSKDTHQY